MRKKKKKGTWRKQDLVFLFSECVELQCLYEFVNLRKKKRKKKVSGNTNIDRDAEREIKKGS